MLETRDVRVLSWLQYTLKSGTMNF